MRTFEVMFGYTWRAMCNAVYKDNSGAQVDSCCILFECSLMHAHERTSFTLHKMYPPVFFEQEVLHVLAELNVVEIARIACACITASDFHSSSN